MLENSLKSIYKLVNFFHTFSQQLATASLPKAFTKGLATGHDWKRKKAHAWIWHQNNFLFGILAVLL